MQSKRECVAFEGAERSEPEGCVSSRATDVRESCLTKGWAVTRVNLLRKVSLNVSAWSTLLCSRNQHRLADSIWAWRAKCAERSEGRSPKAIARFARAEGVGLPEREARTPKGPQGAERRASARAGQRGRHVLKVLQGNLGDLHRESGRRSWMRS